MVSPNLRGVCFEFVLLFFVFCVVSFCVGLVSCYIPTYLDSLKIGIVNVGLLLFLMNFFGMSCSVFLGYLSDVIGRKRTYMLATALTVLSTLLLALATANLYLLWIALPLFGIGAWGRRSVGRVFVAEKFSKYRLEKLFGYYFTIVGISGAVAPFIGGLIASRFGYWTLFLVDSALLVIPILLMLGVSETFEVQVSKSISEYVRDFFYKTRRALTYSRKIVYYYALFCTYLFATDLVIPLLPIYCQHILDFSKKDIGLMYTVATFATLPSYVAGGYLASRIGNVRTIIIALMLNLVILLALPQVSSKYLFIILYALASFIFFLHEAAESAFVISSTSREIRGLVTSTAVTLQGFTTSLAPFIGSIIWKFYGPKTNFYIATILGTLAILTFGKTLTKQEKEQTH